MMDKSSFYIPDTGTISFCHHSWLEDELAWYKFINDVDHETTHWILHHFVNLKASIAYDNIFEGVLNLHLYIGYKDIYKLLIVNALFWLKRKALLVAKREKPFPHYEIHYDKRVEFVRVRRNKVEIFGKSKVEGYEKGKLYKVVCTDNICNQRQEN